MSSNVAQALEHSSRDFPEGDSNPRMLLYRTLIVQNPDIVKVVQDIEKLESLAENEDPRLRPLLLKRVHGYILALASLSSVNGKMLEKLTTTTQAYSVRESNPVIKTGIREMIAHQPLKQENPF